MPIRKGDRVAHIDGILGTALTDQADGAVRVEHDSGVVSTWAIRHSAIVRPGAAGPADPKATPAGRGRKRSAAGKPRPKRKAGPKRKAMPKRKAKRATTRKTVTKPRRKKSSAKARKPASRRSKSAKARMAKK